MMSFLKKELLSDECKFLQQIYQINEQHLLE